MFCQLREVSLLDSLMITLLANPLSDLHLDRHVATGLSLILVFMIVGAGGAVCMLLTVLLPSVWGRARLAAVLTAMNYACTVLSLLFVSAALLAVADHSYWALMDFL